MQQHSLANNPANENTLTNKLLWGAAYGAGFFLSQITPYLILGATSKDNDDLKINFLDHTSLSTAAGTTLSVLTYITISVSFFSAANAAYYLYKKRQKPLDAFTKQKAYELRPTNDINHLYELTVEKGLYNFTTIQKALFFTLFIGFGIFNGFACYPFKDATEKVLPFLPTYGGIYTPLNNEAGWVSFASNLVLNQWFCFQILRDVISKYNGIFKITRPHIHKKNGASLTNIAPFSLLICGISALASLGFIFLAADDDHITCPPNYQKECYPDWRSNITIFATVLVYAGVLNLVGSSSIISKAGSLFDWARDMPSSGKATLSNILKHINPKNLLEEIHYFSNRGRYNNSEQLPLPGQATPIERPKTLSMSELKKRVDIRIRALPNTAVFTKELHRQIINEETLYFESQKNKPLTKSEAWKHSLLRDNLSNTVSMIGPFGIAFILWGYYFLVNEYVASAIGLPNYTAAAKQLTFYSFIPFSVLVLGAGFNSANNLYNAIESLYYKKKNSDALKANQTLAARLPYSERLIPTNTTEKTELVINLFCSVLQISAFLLIAPSAGSAISLLNKYGYDNPFTINVTFWASALINGYGVSNFLNFIEPRITDFFFHNEKREMLNWNENFFKGMGELPDTKYDINKLRFAAQAG